MLENLFQVFVCEVDECNLLPKTSARAIDKILFKYFLSTPSRQNIHETGTLV